jgi:hypothetical protein
MKRPYRNIGIFFLLLLAMVVLGFTSQVPGTPFFGYFSHVGRPPPPIPAIIHLHAFAALAWLALLSVQPFLVRANRLRAHRLLGRCSIAVVALFTLTAVLVMKLSFAHGIAVMPRNDALSLLAQSFSALTLFLLFYFVALLRRRHLHQHVAFMVGASLAVATPGLARLGLYAVGGLPGILLVVAFIYATLAGFLLYAKFRLHQPASKSPYLPIVGLFLLGHSLDFVGSRSTAWLWFADKVVGVW